MGARSWSGRGTCSSTRCPWPLPRSPSPCTWRCGPSGLGGVQASICWLPSVCARVCMCVHVLLRLWVSASLTWEWAAGGPQCATKGCRPQHLQDFRPLWPHTCLFVSLPCAGVCARAPVGDWCKLCRLQGSTLTPFALTPTSAAAPRTPQAEH